MVIEQLQFKLYQIKKKIKTKKGATPKDLTILKRHFKNLSNLQRGSVHIYTLNSFQLMFACNIFRTFDGELEYFRDSARVVGPKCSSLHHSQCILASNFFGG